MKNLLISFIKPYLKMEGFEKNDGLDQSEREEIFSKAVRAGKRTYFFDVKATRKNDYYLTVTESKKRFEQDGRYHFEKHKIFLYKEDFEKFAEGLQEVIDYIKSAQLENIDSEAMDEAEISTAEYSNVDFEDLSK